MVTLFFLLLQLPVVASSIPVQCRGIEGPSHDGVWHGGVGPAVVGGRWVFQMQGSPIELWHLAR